MTDRGPRAGPATPILLVEDNDAEAAHMQAALAEAGFADAAAAHPGRGAWASRQFGWIAQVRADAPGESGDETAVVILTVNS
jgi:hypothetical protein